MASHLFPNDEKVLAEMALEAVLKEYPRAILQLKAVAAYMQRYANSAFKRIPARGGEEWNAIAGVEFACSVALSRYIQLRDSLTGISVLLFQK